MKSIINSRYDLGIYFEDKKDINDLKHKTYFKEIYNLEKKPCGIYLRLSYDFELNDDLFVDSLLFDLKKSNMIDVKLGDNSLEKLSKGEQELIFENIVNKRKVVIFPINYFENKKVY